MRLFIPSLVLEKLKCSKLMVPEKGEILRRNSMDVSVVWWYWYSGNVVAIWIPKQQRRQIFPAYILAWHNYATLK